MSEERKGPRFLGIVENILWEAGTLLFAVGATVSITVEEAGAVLMIAASGVGLLVGRSRPRFFAAVVPVLLYVAGHLVSAWAVSRNPAVSFRFLLHHLWKIPFFFALVFGLGWECFSRTLRLMLSVAAGVAVYGLVQFFTGINWTGRGFQRTGLVSAGPFFEAIGFSGLHLTYGGLMSMLSVVALGLALDARRESPKAGIPWAVAAILTGLATFASLSRSAMVGLFAGLGMTAAFWGRRWWKWLLGFGVIVSVAVVAVPVVRNRVLAIGKLRTDPRYEAWGTAWNMLKRSPIFGLGPGMYERRYDEFRTGGMWWNQGHPHNDVLSTWVDAGLLGLAGYLGMMALFLVYGLRGYRRTGEPMPLALAASVVVMFFQGLSQCYFRTAINLWLFWFLTAGLVIYGFERNIPLGWRDDWP